MSGLSILLRITAIIFVVEGLIMLALSQFEGLSTQAATAIDAVLLVLISSPFIFVLVIRPYVDAQTRDHRIAKEAAERSNCMKDEFLAHMSHELRTPLNAVIGFAQLLQHNPGEPLSEAQTDYANSIIISGEHLLELINDMLDLAAIEADQVRLNLEDFPAKALLEECVVLLRPAAARNAISLHNDLAEGADVVLCADQVRLKQALLNLLSNAVKYNVEGGAVTLDGRATDDGYFRISVTDTGPGIAPEHFDQIFEPFDRLGVQSTHAIEGTGIGLTVTKKLVQLMRGRIGLESSSGEGSTFWIEMPLAAPRPQLVWNEDLSVGIEALDADHKVLVALLNKVSDHSLSHAEVGEVLDELLAYSSYHFVREEALMAACGYPDQVAHQKVHRTLAAKATKLAAQWRESENPEVIAELLDFLRAWLVKHIMEEDKRIGHHAQGHEAEIARALEALKPD